MKKASALTAALSGKQSDATPSITDDAAKHTESFSFPCLDRNGKGSTSEIDDVTHELGKASLKGQAIAGSAPTAVILPNGSVAVSGYYNLRALQGCPSMLLCIVPMTACPSRPCSVSC